VSTLASINKVKPRQAKKFILECIQAGLVPFIQSSPGIGKSAIVKLIAEQYNCSLIDHRLSTSAPEDLSGLPHFNSKGQASFAPFADLFPLVDTPKPDGKDGWILFLDEFNSASKSVQAAAYKLILDRQVGQHRLHKDVALVCAGNLASDRAIVNPLSTAMQSRVVHIELMQDFEEWLMDVAIPQRYDQRIIAFLSQFPSKLMDFRPDHQDKTFCCPRTWEFLNLLVKDKPVDNDRAPLFAGTITSLIATEFVQFCKIFEQVISIDEILKNPEECRLPMDNASRWACTSHMCENLTEKNFEKLCTYISRFTMDFQVLFFRSVMIRYPNLREHPAFAVTMSKLAKYLYSN
jgi:hypothetical protein